MSKVKEYLGILFGGRLIVEGSGRTFAKAPVWLAALMTPGGCVVVLLLGLVTKHAVRFEKDPVRM